MNTYDKQIEEIRLALVAREKAEALLLLEEAICGAYDQGMADAGDPSSLGGEYPNTDELYEALKKVMGGE